MAIEIPQNRVVSPHWLEFKTNEQFRGKDLHFLSSTGIVLSNIKGDSSRWKRDKIILNIKVRTDQIPTPPRPSDGAFVATFKAKHWTVYAGLNAIYNKNHAVNSGHAVDTFKLLNSQNISDNLRVECDIAVSDIDAYLYRIGFKVDLLIYFDEWKEIIID